MEFHFLMTGDSAAALAKAVKASLPCDQMDAANAVATYGYDKAAKPLSTSEFGAWLLLLYGATHGQLGGQYDAQTAAESMLLLATEVLPTTQEPHPR
jgi:hypothetical protein